MRSVVGGNVSGRWVGRKCALLPHWSSSSSSSRGHIRHVSARPALAAAQRDSSSEYTRSSSSSSSRSSPQPNTQDSDAKKRVRARHYYDSTPRHRSKGSRDGGDAGGPVSVADTVADALQASFGDISSSSSSSSADTSSSSTRRSSSSSSSRGRGRGRGVSTRRDYEDDITDHLDDRDDEDGPGWWEVPREQRWGSTAAGGGGWGGGPMELQLEPWQEEQLLLAAASSKKKMQVQTVAANAGLDRNEVLAWVSAFRAKPKAEQAKLLAPLQQQIQRMKSEQQRQSDAAQAAEAARRDRRPPSTQQQQQQSGVQAPPQQQREQQQLWPQLQQQQQGLPFSGKNPDTGFLPFAERRAQQAGSSSSGSSSSSGVGVGVGRSKRLSGEVLRTLEGVYGRSPWPNKEVVAGLFDLHRLPRDVVLEWFAARREMDGLPDNPRKAKQLAAAAAAASQAFGTPQPLLPAELLPPPRSPKQQVPADAATSSIQQQQQQQQQEEEEEVVVPLQQQQQQQQRVQRMTAREMAALRSALPSPRKMKGEKLRKELGIKSGPEPDKKIEISGVTFVAKDGREGWVKAWRKRRAGRGGRPGQQLDWNLWQIGKEEQQQ